jgi:L-lactate permease
MDTVDIIKLALTLVPFVSLFGGFLICHWGSLKTVFVTCILEFIIILTYYQASAMQGIEAAVWGNVSVWPTVFVTFTAQIFGYCYRQTGLMRVMLDSIGALFHKNHAEGQAVALLSPIAGVFANFEGRAAYPVIVPGLVELGYDPVQASAAALVFMTWVMPFASLMIGAIIANMATHVPIPEIAVAVGQFAIPQIFLCTYATFNILGFKFFTHKTQMLYWLTTLPYAVGIFAFTEIWPQYYALSLIMGAALNIACLYLYGRLHKKQTVDVPAEPLAQSLSSAATPAPTRTGNPSLTLTLKGWGPLIVGFAYAAFMLSPVGHQILAHLAFSVAAWGFKPVEVNLFDTPGMPILIGAASAYLFRTQPANLAKDFIVGLSHGVSPMLTFMFGVSVMYLLVFTKQIDFLGLLLSRGGGTLFQLLDAALVVGGGTIFGSGTPTIFTFSTMQMPAVTAFALPLTLLLGLVVVGGIGVTNACKPPNVRFVAALVDVKGGQDWRVFTIGLKWAMLQVVLFTVLAFILIPFWK